MKPERSIVKLPLLLAFVLFVVACAALPSAQLANYLSVSTETEQAGKAIYGELDRAVTFNKQQASGQGSGNCSGSQNNPDCFDPSDFLPSPPISDPDILVRVLALETVSAYNDMLVSLNSGQSGARLSERVTSYTSAAGKFTAVLNGSTGGLSALLTTTTISQLGNLVAAVENARASIVVRESLNEQSTTIQALIVALIKDTPQVYDLYRTSQLIYARTRDGGPRGAEGQREFAKISAMHKSLGAYVVLLGNTAESLELLTSATNAGASSPEALEQALEQALSVKSAAQALEETIRELNARN